jgi:hypothetical protein
MAQHLAKTSLSSQLLRRPFTTQRRLIRTLQNPSCFRKQRLRSSQALRSWEDAPFMYWISGRWQILYLFGQYVGPLRLWAPPQGTQPHSLFRRWILLQPSHHSLSLH